MRFSRNSSSVQLQHRVDMIRSKNPNRRLPRIPIDLLRLNRLDGLRFDATAIDRFPRLAVKTGDNGHSLQLRSLVQKAPHAVR